MVWDNSAGKRLSVVLHILISVSDSYCYYYFEQLNTERAREQLVNYNKNEIPLISLCFEYSAHWNWSFWSFRRKNLISLWGRIYKWRHVISLNFRPPLHCVIQKGHIWPKLVRTVRFRRTPLQGATSFVYGNGLEFINIYLCTSW